MQLPGIKGISVLASIRHIERFSKIPIILLGSSNGDKLSEWLTAEDKVSYLPRPFDGNKFLEKVARFDLPWAISEELPVRFPRLRIDEIHEETKARKG